MEDSQEQLVANTKVVVGAGVVGCILIAIVILQHNLAFQKKGTIVLPAGGTYLGPSPSTAQAPAPQAAPPQTDTSPEASAKGDKFTVAENAPWVPVYGNTYSYSFLAPKALTLVTFPNDKYDIYAISWGTYTPESNVMIGVDNLNASGDKKKYVSVSKRTYVNEWWQQFGGLKGVSSVTEFTNSKGLKGYKAKYINSAGQTPNDDIFFEVPGKPELVIHLSNGVLAKEIFDRIVDSVAWTK